MDRPHCELGGRFSRCHNPPHETCQYCGRDVCREHTYFDEGFEAVCTRKVCRRKRDDLVQHNAYLEIVHRKNRSGLCGIEECIARVRAECSRCHGYFCPDHISARVYPSTIPAEPERRAAVCPHCWDRRKVWSAR